ncbi:MAG: hypothetical protein JNM85_01380 [Chthonomonas sp.]|nr:hypothetical protein [Chthonomonas sp.]
MRLLYNLLLTLLSPLWVPWMLMRARRRADGPDWQERTGNLPFSLPASKRRVWFHAVSVGEVVAALPILKALRANANPPEIVLSVTTSSGHSTAQSQAAELYDRLIYFPIDVPRFVLASLMRVRPNVVAVMETELWLNFLCMAKDLGAKTLLLNGRISDRAYPRSIKVRGYYRALFQSLDQALVQTEVDAQRIRDLGAREVRVLGNCKFDQGAMVPPGAREQWRDILGLQPGERVVVIGSTRGTEDEDFVLEALRSVDLTGVRIVHAPRHLEAAVQLAEKTRAQFGKVALRSKGERGPQLILDTFGELSAAYSIADVAIIGGGFANLGGQNLIQPLAAGVPVLHGVHMQNFAEVSAMAGAAGCAHACATPAELASMLTKWLNGPDERAELGARASALVQANLGASQRYAQAILEALGS